MPGRSYDLVRQTPGGNPGDGTLNGKLTTGPVIIGTGIYTTEQTNQDVGIRLGPLNASDFRLQLANGGQNVELDSQGRWFVAGIVGIQLALQSNHCIVVAYDSVNTVGMGFAPLYGKDVRTGLTSVDASPISLYTTTAAGQVYRVMARILATAGTTPSATYTIKWTEGGATITKTLTISALDSDSDLAILIQPDNNTAITAQLTAISGTGTTVNVAATVEQMTL